MTSGVEVTRGGRVESLHIVHVAVAHAERGLVATCGNPRHVSFVRSAIKMFQALPLAEDDVMGALGLTAPELALCAASHNGETFHVEAARSILSKAGLMEDALACGPHEPLLARAADALRSAGVAPGRIHNNCSGKHAGMLALARHHGWPLASYARREHPVQRRVAHTLSRYTAIEAAAIPDALDGCGLPTFALPLDAVALACARFAAEASQETAARVLFRAMHEHPAFVAGTERLCTALMQVARVPLFAKVGAEGYYCAGVPQRQLGIALKVQDGARRAAEPALLAVLHELDVLTGEEMRHLEPFGRPLVSNTRGETVGEIRANLRLMPAR